MGVGSLAAINIYGRSVGEMTLECQRYASADIRYLLSNQ